MPGANPLLELDEPLTPLMQETSRTKQPDGTEVVTSSPISSVDLARQSLNIHGTLETGELVTLPSAFTAGWTVRGSGYNSHRLQSFYAILGDHVDGTTAQSHPRPRPDTPGAGHRGGAGSCRGSTLAPQPAAQPAARPRAAAQPAPGIDEQRTTTGFRSPPNAGTRYSRQHQTGRGGRQVVTQPIGRRRLSFIVSGHVQLAEQQLHRQIVGSSQRPNNHDHARPICRCRLRASRESTRSADCPCSAGCPVQRPRQQGRNMAGDPQDVQGR